MSKAKNKNKEVLSDERKKEGQITLEWRYCSFICIHNEGEKKCKKETKSPKKSLKNLKFFTNPCTGGAGVDEAKAKMSIWIMQTLVKIQCPKNLRVPSQGSSIEGESRPKIRLKGIVNGQRVNILVWSPGMKEARLAERWLSIQGCKVIQKVMESLFLRMERQFWMSPRITNSAIL